jgi:predicted RNA-binding protein with PUA-like domain
MKSEPDVFGWHHLVARKEPEQWHGVRNFAARNNMMKMKLGERAFFYHSNIGKEIVGIMKIVATAHPDTTAEPNAKGNVVWQCVDVVADRPLERPVTLEAIKADAKLSSMALVKYSRLSVQPVTDEEWAHILKLGGL